jgi:hypothetical protein
MSKLVDFSDYSDLDYLVVIPSKGRAKHIEKVEEMFPNAVLFVNEEEIEQYQKYANLPIISHKQTMGYGSVANDVFRRAKKNNIRYIVMMDDDKDNFSCLAGNRQRYFDAEQIVFVFYFFINHQVRAE